MFTFENDANLVDDREDLLAVLHMRFGTIAPGIIDEVYQLNDLDSIERLILVAANAPDLKTFLIELEEGKDSYKIVGDQYDPLGTPIPRSEADDTTKKQ